MLHTMTAEHLAFAHDYPLQVPVSPEIDAVMDGVIADHLAAFNAALAPLGVTMEDLLPPVWMRVVRVPDISEWSPATVSADGDVETCSLEACDGTCSTPRAEAAAETARGCGRCGSGTPCSPESCAGGSTAAQVDGERNV